MTADDRERGLYEKYMVTRTDGSDAGDCKHEYCEYFVLDLMHDPFALPALRAYRSACMKEYPELARDLASEVVEMMDRFDCLPFIPTLPGEVR